MVTVSISKEDYLKAIAEAKSEGEKVSSVTLVRWLNVSPPAASMALKRLQRDKLVRMDSGGGITLTAEGQAIAERVLRRHHLLERMLTEMFGFEWYKVHDEAERLEHAISDDFERKLVEILGEEGLCPHGNALGMDTPDSRRAQGMVPLAEAEAGVGFRLTSVFERDRKLLEYLDGLGLKPGEHVTVESKNWDDTVTLSAHGRAVVLGRRAAELVWVKTERTVPAAR